MNPRQKMKEAGFIEPFRKMWDERFHKLEAIMKAYKTKKQNTMEQKTKVSAEEGKQELRVTRDFDLPLGLLFKACIEPDIIEQWMTTKVLKLENKKHGSYQLEKTDEKGNVLFRANGVIHEFIPERKIVRTFEMENTPVGVQLEFYEFESLTDDTCWMNMHVIYESVAQRDQVLQYGMVKGMEMAHDRIQAIASKLK